MEGMSVEECWRGSGIRMKVSGSWEEGRGFIVVLAQAAAGVVKVRDWHSAGTAHGAILALDCKSPAVVCSRGDRYLS